MGGSLALAARTAERARASGSTCRPPSPAAEPGAAACRAHVLQQHRRAQLVDAGLGSAGRTATGVSRGSLETYWRHSLERTRTSSVHGAIQRVDVVDDRLDEHEPPAARQRVDQRPQVLLGAGRAQALDAVAPVGDAEVVDRPHSVA